MIPVKAGSGVVVNLLPRLAAATLVQIGVLALLSIFTYVAALFQALGLFYATELAFFPLFARSEMQNFAMLFLPVFGIGIIFMIFLSVLLALVGKERKPSTRARAYIIFLGSVFLLVAASYFAFRSIVFSILLAVFIFLNVWSRQQLRRPFRLDQGLAGATSTGLGVAGLAGCLLIVMFSFGYIGGISALVGFPTTRASAIVEGKRQKVVVLFPGAEHTLFYDGKRYRVAGRGFLETLQTEPR